METNYVRKVKQYILLFLDRDVVNMQTMANVSGPSMINLQNILTKKKQRKKERKGMAKRVIIGWKRGVCLFWNEVKIGMHYIHYWHAKQNGKSINTHINK